MNFKEIVKELKQQKNVDGVNYKRNFADYELDKKIFGKTETVDEEGGYEGGGESMYIVKHFVDHNVFIRLNGFYTSYSGTDFDDYDFEEVFPIERTVTFYETKKETKEANV